MSLASLAGFLFYQHVPHHIAGIHISFVTAALYGIFIGISSLVVSIAFPGFRFAMEAFAVSRLTFAMVVAMFPAIAPITVQSPFINATIVIIGGVTLSSIFYSDAIGRLFPKRSHVTIIPPSLRPQSAPSGEITERRLSNLKYGVVYAGARRELARFAESMAEGKVATVQEVGIDSTQHVEIRHGALSLRTLFAAWLDDAQGRILNSWADSDISTELAPQQNEAFQELVA